MKKYKLIKYKKGSVILKDSQNPKDSFYIISRGSAVSYNNFYNEKYTYKMGNIIGLISSVTKEPYYSTVETIEDTYLFEIKTENINKINNKHLINRITNYLTFILETWLSKYYSIIVNNKIDLYNKEDILIMASIYKNNGFTDASYRLCSAYINLFSKDYNVDNVKDFIKNINKSKEPEHINNNSYKMYKGYCLYCELETTNHIYYIKSGKIGIYNIVNSNYVARMIYPRGYIISSYTPTLEYKTLLTTAIVLEDSIIDIMTKDELIKILYNDADARLNIIKIISMKIISTALKIKAAKKTELKDKLIVLIYSVLKIENLFYKNNHIKLYYTIEDIKNMLNINNDIKDIKEVLKDINYLEYDNSDTINITNISKYFSEYKNYT